MSENRSFSNKNKPFHKRFGYALKGLRSTWLREPSFRFQCYCALALLLFCLIVKPSAEWCALFTFATILVLTLECVNTSIEVLLDKLHPKHDPLIGFVKDCLAGAVLLASFGSVVIFCIFILNHFNILG